MKKRELKKELKYVEHLLGLCSQDLDEVKKRNAELEVWYENNKLKVQESEMWRTRFEQSQLTPEYKLKAEDAYNRGVANTQENVKNYLRRVVDSLYIEPADKPKISSWLTEEK